MLWILLVILIIGIVLLIVYKKYEKFVFEHSITLRKLDEINSKYDFYEIKKYKLEKGYDNEHYYDMVSTEDYLIYNLQYIQKEVKENISLVVKNQNLYDLYKAEINEINTYTQFDEKPLKVIKLLLYIENKLFQKYQKNPTTEFTMLVVLHLTNINGHILNTKYRGFYVDEIEDLIYRVRNKTGDKFNDKNIWNAIKHVERAKVSNRLRFMVYERDGYRCKKCGRKTNDLEIDHIIPISKGGKTTLDNLQTLCRSCNVEKSDIIEPGVFGKSEKYNRFCPYCGAPLKVVNGKNGEFYGCMNYPRCNYTTRK